MGSGSTGGDNYVDDGVNVISTAESDEEYVDHGMVVNSDEESTNEDSFNPLRNTRFYPRF